jgi:hypothetical protein
VAPRERRSQNWRRQQQQQEGLRWNRHLLLQLLTPPR